MPAHNEQHRIGSTLAAYRATCTDPGVRFLVGLDDCTDATASIVERHAAEDPRVCIFSYPRLGKGGVLMETFRHCRAEFVAFVDADCATMPNELLRLTEEARTADGAIASRRHPASLVPARRSLTRRLTSAGFAFGVRRLFRLPYRDTQCGAKVIRRDVLWRVLPLLSSRDFVFDVDLLYVARRLGYEVLEVPTIWIDRDGSRVRASADAKRMAASLLRLWLHHRVIPVQQAQVASPVIDMPDEPRRTDTDAPVEVVSDAAP
ncbi:MAG: glycosyltransferase [Burkholderiales bacterium]